VTPSEQAEAHDANFVAAITLLADLSRSGSKAAFGDVATALTGIPAPFFNAGWALGAADQRDIGAAVDHLRASGLPFTLHVPSDRPVAAAAARAIGLVEGGRLPCFALAPGPIPPAPPALEIVRVGPRAWDDFVGATATSFGMPIEMVHALYPPAMLDDSRVRAFLGSVDGSAVATSVAIRTGATLGVYSIGTVPEARGRGYGSALTWHLMRDADPGWEVAVLQASEMGRPVYERMGFQLVREFVEFFDTPAT